MSPGCRRATGLARALAFELPLVGLTDLLEPELLGLLGALQALRAPLLVANRRLRLEMTRRARAQRGAP